MFYLKRIPIASHLSDGQSLSKWCEVRELPSSRAQTEREAMVLWELRTLEEQHQACLYGSVYSTSRSLEPQRFCLPWESIVTSFVLYPTRELGEIVPRLSHDLNVSTTMWLTRLKQLSWARQSQVSWNILHWSVYRRNIWQSVVEASMYLMDV